jgi:AcrR family transcriptional regulator
MEAHMRVVPRSREKADHELFKRKKEMDESQNEHRHHKRTPRKKTPSQMLTDATAQKQIIAAAMFGEGKYTINEIAQVVGISRRQIQHWKSKETFAVMVRNAGEAYAKRFLTEGLARKERRLAVLNDMHERVLTSVFERGESKGMKNIPGGHTGMVTKTLKGIGKGDDFQVVEVYSIDTPVISSLIEIHDAVREELGQNVRKHEFSNPDGSPMQPPQITVQVVGAVIHKEKAAAIKGDITAALPPAPRK